MDIKVLQYYIAVVETTNITKAAKLLHISQPPLSQALKQLESELGAVLFERGSREITLTSAGETLYHRAKNIVDFTEETCREIKDIGSGSKGHIRLGLISSFSPNSLSEIIRKFSVENAGIRFDIYERNTYELLEQLDNNMIELAFVRSPFDNSENYSFVKLVEEPLVAFGKQEFFGDITDELLAPGFFNDKPIILYRRWKYILDEYFKSEGVYPFYCCFCDDAKTATLLASSGKGIAFVPEGVATHNEGSKMVFHPLNTPNLSTSIYAIWRSNHYISPAAKKLICMIKDLYGSENGI